MNICRAGSFLLLAALLPAGLGAAGCSKKDDPQVAADSNAFPANYRKDIAKFLTQSLTNRADFRGAMISEPAMKPVALPAAVTQVHVGNVSVWSP